MTEVNSGISHYKCNSQYKSLMMTNHHNAIIDDAQSRLSSRFIFVLFTTLLQRWPCYRVSQRGTAAGSQDKISGSRLTKFFLKKKRLEYREHISARCTSQDVECPRSLKIREYWVVLPTLLHFFSVIIQETCLHTTSVRFIGKI